MLGEYLSPNKFFGAELGLRADHYYLTGKDFNLNSLPVLNPRLNLDFNLLKRGASSGQLLESLGFTIGTGLFSAYNLNGVAFLTDSNARNYDFKPDRSWTSVAGVNAGFQNGFSINIEGFYKYVYDRTYFLEILEGNQFNNNFRSGGDGKIWGFDVMLQKFSGRHWDGWLSYTFTNAKYHESESTASDYVTIEDSGWYYPEFHRFHNINLVMNYKPTSKVNIYTRLGVASGVPLPVFGEIKEYEVLAEDGNGNSTIINKYYRDSSYSESSRTPWSFPFDLKFSYFRFNPRNKVKTEFYIAIESLFSLIYRPKPPASLNPYTGKTSETAGGSIDVNEGVNFDLGIPMPSLGIKWSF
jgi:hypothetical protein